jgi:Protein of unknown function (DUF2283)
MAKGKIELEVSRGDRKVAYLSLPDHPGAGTPGVVVKQLRLIELCGKYTGPDIYLDFDKDNQIVGIEVIA